MTPPQASLRHVIPLVVGLLTLGGPATAQEEVRVRVEENFRSVPNGPVLGRLDPGTTLTVLGRQGNWTEVELEAWIWTRSLQIVNREGMDLVVAESEGENLRDGPSGAVLGRLGEGTLLLEQERVPGWIRARRQGWIWGPSLVQTAAPQAPDEPEVAAPSSGGSGAGGRAPSSTPPTGLVRSGARGAAVLGGPDGDTLATTVPGSELEVLERQGGWARVRLEGWTWLPVEAEEASSAATPGRGEQGALEPLDLTERPDEYRGRVVTWRVQFISLEEAERVRTDFFEGEPFLLTRFGGAQGPFVYVAVSPERLPSVQGLTPLEYLTVTGRVRTGASALTGTPIVDLMSLSRESGDP